MKLAPHILGVAKALVQPRARRVVAAPPHIRFIYAHEGAPARYRVHNQIEQARLAGFTASAALLTNPAELYALASGDVLVFYRVPLGPRTAALLLLARRWGVRTVFDSDDLTWDERQHEYEFLDQHYDAITVAQILKTARRMAACMRRVDALLFSTPFLAEMAATVTPRPRLVCMNAVSAELVTRSAAVYDQAATTPHAVRIGYFSGQARSHDEDLASIAPALATLLQALPQVTLTLCGDVALPQLLEGAMAQIERRPMVDWRDLPAEIARVDLNIAPILDNAQRRGKSAVKYLEAALVGVPTIASRLDPYTAVIHAGRTGLLANTPEEWAASLRMLCESLALRRQIGAAARTHVLAEHTTTARAASFRQAIQSILKAS